MARKKTSKPDSTTPTTKRARTRAPRAEAPTPPSPPDAPNPPASDPAKPQVKRTRRARKSPPVSEDTILFVVAGVSHTDHEEALRHQHRVRLLKRGEEVADALVRSMPKASPATRKALADFVRSSVLSPDVALKELVPLLQKAAGASDPLVEVQVLTAGELAARAQQAANTAQDSQLLDDKESTHKLPDPEVAPKLPEPPEPPAVGDELEPQLDELDPPPGLSGGLRPPPPPVA